MARRVVSVLRSAPAAMRAGDPVLEANAYAVAEDVDLTLVLRGPALELALVAAEVRPAEVAGVGLPAAAHGRDLRGLVESGVRVLVARDDLAAAGLGADDLVAGVEVVTGEVVAQAVAGAEGVLAW